MIFVKVKAWNNVIYDFDGTDGCGFIDNEGDIYYYAYNNTVRNCTRSFSTNQGADRLIIKNNITQSCPSGFYAGGATNSPDSTFNITDTSAEDLAFGVTHSTGTATTNTLNKLVDTGATFITDGVQIGSIVANTTDGTYGYVTAVDSETSLSLDTDIFPDGNENYKVYTNMYGSVSFADENGDNFHITSAAMAKDAGTDLSSDPDLSFSDDIDGDSRLSPYWDIGADEYNATESVKSRGSLKLRGDFKFR